MPQKMDDFQNLMKEAHKQIMEFLQEKDPFMLTVSAFAAGYVISSLYAMHTDDRGLRYRLRSKVFRLVRCIPYVKNRIRAELEGVRKDVRKAIHETDKSGQFLDELPSNGMNSGELLSLVREYDNMEAARYLDGRCSGAVFNDESDLEEMKVYTEVFSRFAWSNPLWPKLFPGVRKMEAEVVRICCTMMHGDERSCGTMSTGGTVSILLACLAHRNRALSRGVQFPEMIIPTSAHAAFTKAAELFRIKLVQIPVDKETFKVDLKQMRRAISSRTCMLVGSTPNFPFGTVDDIEEIGQMGLQYDVPVHVDACLGGFLLPFIDDKIPFDFRVPGVCSISADTHKYGLSPKGSSVVLYKNEEYIHHQYFCDTDWQGGIYASSTMEGSRAGVNIALCWASLLYQGKDNYRKNAQKVVDTTRKIRDGITSIPELRLQGSSDICIVSWTSDVIDVHRLSDLLHDKHWQLTNLQFPTGMHLMVTLNHTHNGVADELIRDVREAVEHIKRTPEERSTGPAALYGMAQKIPDRSIVREFALEYLDACYSRPSL